MVTNNITRCMSVEHSKLLLYDTLRGAGDSY